MCSETVTNAPVHIGLSSNKSSYEGLQLAVLLDWRTSNSVLEIDHAFKIRHSSRDYRRWLNWHEIDQIDSCNSDSLILPLSYDVPASEVSPMVLSAMTGFRGGLSLRASDRKFGWRIIANSRGQNVCFISWTFEWPTTNPFTCRESVRVAFTTYWV